MSLLLLFDDDEPTGPLIQGFRRLGAGLRRAGSQGAGILRAGARGAGIKKAGAAVLGLALAGLVLAGWIAA